MQLAVSEIRESARKLSAIHCFGAITNNDWREAEWRDKLCIALCVTQLFLDCVDGFVTDFRWSPFFQAKVKKAIYHNRNEDQGHRNPTDGLVRPSVVYYKISKLRANTDAY